MRALVGKWGPSVPAVSCFQSEVREEPSDPLFGHRRRNIGQMSGQGAVRHVGERVFATAFTRSSS